MSRCPKCDGVGHVLQATGSEDDGWYECPACNPHPSPSRVLTSRAVLRPSPPEDFTPAQWEHLIDAADLAWWRSFQALGNAQSWGSYTHRQTFMRAAIAAYESARGDRSKPPPQAKPEGATMGEDTSVIPTAISRRERRIADLTARAEAAEKERDMHLASCADVQHMYLEEIDRRLAAEAERNRMREALAYLVQVVTGDSDAARRHKAIWIANAALSPAPGGSSGEADHA